MEGVGVIVRRGRRSWSFDDEVETDGHLWGPRFVGHQDTGA